MALLLEKKDIRYFCSFDVLKWIFDVVVQWRIVVHAGMMIWLRDSELK